MLGYIEQLEEDIKNLKISRDELTRSGEKDIAYYREVNRLNDQILKKQTELNFLTDIRNKQEKSIEKVEKDISKLEDAKLKTINNQAEQKEKIFEADRKDREEAQRLLEIDLQRLDAAKNITERKQADIKSARDTISGLYGSISPEFDMLNSGVEILNTLLAKKLITEENYLKNRNKLYAQYLINESANIYNQYSEIVTEALKREIDAYDNRLSEIQNDLAQEKKDKDEGLANEYDSLVTQQFLIKKEREKALAEYKKMKKIEAQVNLVSQISNLILASAEIFQAEAKKGLPGVIIAIASIAAMLGSFLVYKAKINAISQDDGFATGVIKYKGKGTRTSDSNTVRISKDESIITAIGTDNAPKTLDLINRGKMTDQDIMYWHTMNQIYSGYRQKDNTHLLVRELKGNKNATLQLLEYTKNGERVFVQGDKEYRVRSNSLIITTRK